MKHFTVTRSTEDVALRRLHARHYLFRWRQSQSVAWLERFVQIARVTYAEDFPVHRREDAIDTPTRHCASCYARFPLATFRTGSREHWYCASCRDRAGERKWHVRLATGTRGRWR